MKLVFSGKPIPLQRPRVTKRHTYNPQQELLEGVSWEAHVKTMVAPRVRSSYQTDRVAWVEVEGLPLAGVVRSAIQLVEYNIGTSVIGSRWPPTAMMVFP